MDNVSFEYKTLLLSPIQINTEKLDQTLTRLGSEGWYLVFALPDYLIMERVLYGDSETEQSTEG